MNPHWAINGPVHLSKQKDRLSGGHFQNRASVLLKPPNALPIEHVQQNYIAKSFK
jgi:hypothetical protein